MFKVLKGTDLFHLAKSHKKISKLCDDDRYSNQLWVNDNRLFWTNSHIAVFMDIDIEDGTYIFAKIGQDIFLTDVASQVNMPNPQSIINHKRVEKTINTGFEIDSESLNAIITNEMYKMDNRVYMYLDSNYAKLACDFKIDSIYLPTHNLSPLKLRNSHSNTEMYACCKIMNGEWLK